MPAQKEPAFFAYNFDKGWPWYESLFRAASPANVCGEASVAYSSFKHAERACQRINECFPDTRLIVMARNPIPRLESCFRQLHQAAHRMGINTPYDIGDALRDLPTLIEDTRYWQRINTFRERFPDDRIHVVFFEDFVNRPADELTKCFRFLGVNPSARIGSVARKLNSAGQKYYDTKLMRYVRSQRFLGALWRTMPDRIQDWIGKSFGLRRRFDRPVTWDPVTYDWVIEQVTEETHRFLEFYGKPMDFWDLNCHDPRRSEIKQAA